MFQTKHNCRKSPKKYTMKMINTSSLLTDNPQLSLMKLEQRLGILRERKESIEFFLLVSENYIESRIFQKTILFTNI